MAALMFTGMTTMLVGGGLLVSSAHYSQAFSEARSESALLLAEGGVNDELAQLAETPGMPTPSDPTIASGETMTYPGEDHAVYGRKGTLDGGDGTYWVCTSGNEWWRSGATPTEWDGVTDIFWVTATSYVKGAWRRTETQVSKQSLFGQYALYTNAGDDTCADSGVSLAVSASVSINGTAGTNGKVTCGSGASLSVGACVNANKNRCSAAQYTSANLKVGGTICQRNAAYTYPTCSAVLKKSCGLNNYSDSSAWNWIKTNNDNATGIYTYKSGATSATISTGSCTRSTYTGTTCANVSVWSSTSKGAWDYARVKPGTSSKVKTLIFEPGDYYFSTIYLDYDASTEIVIDPNAYASGGTPGQVRFWVNDTSWFAIDDNVSLPVQMTKAGGTTDPDPSLFRVYYGKDGRTLNLNRPSGCQDYNGNALTGDFTLSAGVYAITRSAKTDGCSSYVGASVKLTGTTGTTGGKSCFNGSLMCDKASFSGGCKVDVNTKCGNKKDPPCGAKVCGGYRSCR